MAGEVKIISRTYRKINGKYYARIRYKIDDGKPLDILRQVENKSAIKPKQAEIEAASPDVSSLDAAELEHMTIDELRAVANALDVPDRAQITEQDELIAAIRQRL